ncbi:glycosyltransferase family 1 protein [Devosia algicola]|uniref:Glycosyltransferase family 1 protein n=1 Tax=Devosia algicola TaxID=3026418 RepID=A0ABY7YP22_9HYPH|nr:glycosyltransferase family 1 protein [Devosia algicola]WDR02942.1 glycosyltransferase family 1 protein [Devosia algicola]
MLRNEGLAGALDRTRARLASAIEPATTRRIVRDDDILNADLDEQFVPSFAKPGPDEAITLNWLMTAPNPGSGGHTTIFRIIRYLEANGYHNRVYFYDARLGSIDQYVHALRDYYGFHGPVERFDGSLADAHGVFATSWPTAYASCATPSSGKRFYFVQDYEPDFYAVSTDRILAENTYRMGFHAITAGRWLAEKLGNDFAMNADAFEFGCDTTKYSNRHGPRNGIAFYARPGTPRRGYELGLLALRSFAAKHPEIDIHLYGEDVGPLPFRAINHGLVRPEQLNEIYNKCFAGLSLSLTNVSLVPLEMLAAGCIPVLNDAYHNRMVIESPYVHYAAATPQALARSLSEIVDMPDFYTYARAASESQDRLDWESAGAVVDQAIRRVLNAGP